MKIAKSLKLALACLLAPAPVLADDIGQIGVDWIGNDIIIEAVDDPKVEGVTCHVAYFERGIIDRLAKGSWFEDPSNSAIECNQTGPITVGNIDLDRDGEDVFRASRSILFKSLRVKRIYDAENHVLVYVAHGREITEGSAKVSLSTIPLPPELALDS